MKHFCSLYLPGQLLVLLIFVQERDFCRLSYELEPADNQNNS